MSELLAALEPYPLLKECFSRYVSWICDNDADAFQDHVLVRKLKYNEGQPLRQLEELLEKTRRIMGLRPIQFARTFGFLDDLVTADPEKIHNILAEPLFAIDLDRCGFACIERLKAKSGEIAQADFTAIRQGEKFAIELKTVRTESWAEEGKLLSDSTKPSWWSEMFISNAVTKIEDKDRRVIRQLEETREAHDCDHTLLVIYTRRLGPSTLMDSNNYKDALKALKRKYPKIDYFCCKDYFATSVEFHPPLRPST